MIECSVDSQTRNILPATGFTLHSTSSLCGISSCILCMSNIHRGDVRLSKRRKEEMKEREQVEIDIQRRSWKKIKEKEGYH